MATVQLMLSSSVVVRPLFGCDITIHCGTNFSIQHTVPMGRVLAQDAVRRLCKERGTWTFKPKEVVRALPDLNERSVRTHIVSRCCINAPQHHPHKWDYFRRIRRGVYELVPKYRKEPSPKTPRKAAPIGRVAETLSNYGSPDVLTIRDSIHVTITRGERAYVAECLEIAVVTQGSTLDEIVHNLREAVSLHLEGEDREILGLSPDPRLIFNIELPLEHVSKT